MFDIGWSELLVLGIIALIFVGPKELPGLLRTIGRYAGVLKQQAAEFRAHFDQALKEAELDQLKNDITGLRNEVEGAARDAMRSAEKQAESAGRAIKNTEGKKAAASAPSTPGTPISEPDPFDGPDITDENGMPIETGKPADAASKSAEPSGRQKAEVSESVPKPASAVEKTGADEP